MLCKHGNISDTQTGLRAIPNEVLYKYLTLYGEIFEYETVILIESLHNYTPISEVCVDTLYINNNSETHFKPVADSWAIHKLIFDTFFKYILSSLSAALIDLIDFTILTSLMKNVELGLKIGIATVAARIISSFYNYNVNKNIVFVGKGESSTFFKYYIVCILQMYCSMVGVYAMCYFAHIGESVSKIIVDAILFLFSFQIQRTWTFRK